MREPDAWKMTGFAWRRNPQTGPKSLATGFSSRVRSRELAPSEPRASRCAGGCDCVEPTLWGPSFHGLKFSSCIALAKATVRRPLSGGSMEVVYKQKKPQDNFKWNRFAALLVVGEKRKSAIGLRRLVYRAEILSLAGGVLRLPNSHCCSLGWAWTTRGLRAVKLISACCWLFCSEVPVSIKIAREAELPSDFTFVDCGIVYCTSTVYHRRVGLSSGLSQESKIFYQIFASPEKVGRAWRKPKGRIALGHYVTRILCSQMRSPETLCA